MREVPLADQPDNIRKQLQLQFGGLDRREGAGDGAFCDMLNMSVEAFPLLKTRPPRGYGPTLTGASALYPLEKLYYVQGNQLLRLKDNPSQGGDVCCALSNTSQERTLCALGRRLIVFPDKICYDTSTGSAISLAFDRAFPGVTFGSGTYGGTEAANNAILLPAGAEHSLRVGDGVTITGCAVPENNKTAILREIDAVEGRTRLNFDVNCFTPPSEGTESWQENVTLSRTVPDLDYLCVNENRLWGCKGDTIYASKLGDPCNWNVFEGISTDAWSVESGQPGDFTACVSFLGYPCFFKERRVFKVFGNKPSNYQLEPGADLGVKAGCGKSLAIANNTLYYVSPAGPVAYNGGIPQNIGEPLGDLPLLEAVGGSDGRRWYLSAHSLYSAAWFTLTYDTQVGLWAREDTARFVSFAHYRHTLYAFRDSGRLCALAWYNNMGLDPETSVQSSLETGDFTAASPDKKGVGKLHLRVKLAQGASLTVSIRFDSGAWETVKTVTGTGSRRSYYLPIIPRRADHFRLRLSATNAWTLESLAREEYSGSPL